jgi:hypothetical protein
MMSHYFVAGNLWLVVAAVVYCGRVPNTAGDLSGWKLFGIGRAFEAGQYPWCLGVPIALAAVCFALYWRVLQEPTDAAGAKQ